MPKCDRCGSTENVQRSLVVDMPAKCLKCMDEEMDAFERSHALNTEWLYTEWLHDSAHAATEYGNQ